MNSIHIALAASAALLGITAWIVLRTNRQRAFVLAVTCGSLAVGHLASLLETAPVWYSVGVTVGTLAGFGWVVWALVASRRSAVERVRVTRSVRSRGAAPAARAATERSDATERRLYAVPAEPEIVDAEIVEDEPSERAVPPWRYAWENDSALGMYGANGGRRGADAGSGRPETPAASNVVSIMRDRPGRQVTARQIFAASPRGSHGTMGATYVAANMARYVHPKQGTPSARTHRQVARVHGRPQGRAVSPEAKLRALQVRAAYEQPERSTRLRGGRDFRA